MMANPERQVTNREREEATKTDGTTKMEDKDNPGNNGKRGQPGQTGQRGDTRVLQVPKVKRVNGTALGHLTARA